MFAAHQSAEERTSFLQVMTKQKPSRNKETNCGGSKAQEHLWSQRGRDARRSNYAPFSAPASLSKGPSWMWQNEFDEQVRHSPLIDNKLNIYVATATRLRKFTPNGSVVWMHKLPKDEGKMFSSPALYKGNILLISSSKSGSSSIKSISMATGNTQWKRSAPYVQWHDASSVSIANDTMTFAARSSQQQAGHPGNDVVHAVNATSGDHLWIFNAGELLWNFSPASLDDGSLLFGSSCGGVYHVSPEGKLIWRHGQERKPGEFCSTGGGALGANSIFYMVSNNMFFDAVHGAQLTAYDTSNGSLVWKKTLSTVEPGMQAPAIGRLDGNGKLAVLIGTGYGPLPPSPANAALNNASSKFHFQNTVLALDAETGSQLWQFWEPPWTEAAGAGEDARFKQRTARAQFDDREDVMCRPDPQGVPLIGGNGTVYVSSGLSGDLFAIKDVDGNGEIDEHEVDRFSTNNCFLNSPSLASGLLVAAPCWGPMYVFKT